MELDGIIDLYLLIRVSQVRDPYGLPFIIKGRTPMTSLSDLAGGNRQMEAPSETDGCVLYKIKCAIRRNKLKCGGSRRSMVKDKHKDMKRISQHLGEIAHFRYIANSINVNVGGIAYCVCRILKSRTP